MEHTKTLLTERFIDRHYTAKNSDINFNAKHFNVFQGIKEMTTETIN